MPDREVLSDERHPVIAGLIALVGVGLAVGLIAGLAALVGVQVLGIGNAGASSRSTDAQSLYLPRPKPTKGPSGPLVTLPGDPTTSAAEESKKPKKDKKQDKKKQGKEITLSASQTSVSPMEQIDLTGVYPGGEGAILQVQYFNGGKWEGFYSVSANVSDETFATYVQTSQTGVQRFRVVDSDTGLASNEVKITVG